MATTKATEGSRYICAILAAIDHVTWNKGSMDNERFGRMSLEDASFRAGPAPKKSRHRRRPQRPDLDTQISASLKPKGVTKISEETSELTSAAHQSVSFQSKQKISQQPSVSQPPDGGVYLPRPDRSGTQKDDKGGGSGGSNGPMNETVLAAYQPLGTSSVGNSQIYRFSSSRVFTPHQPVRSVLQIRKLPPGVDKWYRYKSAPAGQTSIIPSKEVVSPIKDRWTGSPPRASVGNKFWPSTLDPSVSRAPERARSESLSRDPKIHLPAPIPTPKYISQASNPPSKLPEPQSLLLVLDLNGTLLMRKRASKSYTPRPSLEHFLAYCFEHHSVLIWSSATPGNVTGICSKVFSQKQRKKLLGEWGRDTLGLTPTQYMDRVQVYKNLDRIWDSESLSWKGVKWDQGNTVLIDDSALKASAQPHNLVEIPEFTKEKEETSDVLAQVVGYLEEARTWEDVSTFIKDTPFRVDRGWANDWKM
ncbi:hypothetical protein MMC08_000932 [Hypocenomyce scalaris]|nr:hypothetical protein [Hypocenomyce scalaris]